MQKSTGPIGTHRKGVPFHIYGTGISGLLIGYYLKKNGHKVTLYEKEGQSGGKISTKKNQYGMAEQAANAVFTNDDVFELIKELKLDYIEANKKLKRKIWRGSLKNLRVLSLFEIFRIFLGLFKRVPEIRKDMSVKDFFLPLLGNRVCDEVLSSALSGIYATTSDQLHFLSIFKVSKDFQGNYLKFFKELKKTRKSTHKPVSISFKNGMQDFIDHLSVYLKDNIHYNTSPELEESVNNIICTDAQEASKLTQFLYPSLSKELEKIDYLTLSTSTYILNTKMDVLENSFGMLFPRNFNFQTMGILNNTAIFNRSSEQNLHSYTFITPLKDQLKETHLKEMKVISNKDLEFNIKYESHRVWERGIPFYNYQRFKTIEELRAKIYQFNAGIILFGNYVDGISIREMVSHSKNFAETR